MRWVDADVVASAEDFWTRTGGTPKYPRSLEPGVFLGYSVAVVRLPRLRTLKAIEWLNRRGIPHPRDAGDRPLHGYIAARGGSAIVFIEGGDPDDEQRFSLAHEIAHFLYDYLRPREVAIRALGTAITDVLDGHRLPTPAERLAGVLRGVPLGYYSHLRDRPAGSSAAAEFEIEDKADQLALELLAPFAQVLLSARRRAADNASALNELLAGNYGLPPSIARIYGRMVLSALRSGRSFRQWLGVN